MCRIAGIIDHSNTISLQQAIVAMRDSMQRGGPDDSGILVDEENHLAFGHRRLSLLDLSSAGHQPMHGDGNRATIIFNGEIYNFQEIRAELTAKGYTFKTATDTEVILAAYDAFGTACFQKFNGMFALAIWDKTKHQLILARDHAGIKPLYYFINESKVIFASEIRAFKALDAYWPEDDNWKIPFLTYGHLPAPFTTLKNVHPLKKGCFITIDLADLKYTQSEYHRFVFSNTILNEADAVALVKEKLDQSVQRHLISDAPIGLFLSGGLDSSLLTLIANKYIGKNLKTLSIVFEDASLNEGPYQQLIVDKTNAHHQSFLVTEKEFEQELPDILQAMDQPSTDGVNSYFICKYARQYGLTAVLSGLGADELFGGYPSFNRAVQIERLQHLPASILGLSAYFPNQKINKVSFTKSKDITGNYLFNRGFYTPDKVARLLDVSPTHVVNVLRDVAIDTLPNTTNRQNKVSWAETNLYMQNQLLKDTDYMSMWHSLEVRVPFLDKEVMQAAFSIAPQIKFNAKQGKHLLIKAFEDVLPTEIYQRKKQGFTFPFYKWMHHVLPAKADANFDKIRKQYTNGKTHWSRYWCYILSLSNNAVVYKNALANRVLFLNLTSFSITGGIEKFNRAFLHALNALEKENSLSAHSISLHDNNIDEKYFPADSYRGFKGKKYSFVWQVVRAASKYDTIIVGHLNLALPATIIKAIFPSKKIILIAHGFEVWDQLTGSKHKLVQQADTIVAVSNFTASKLRDVQGIAANKIQILHNTIDPYFELPGTFNKPQYLRDRYGIHNGDKIVYTMTRLSSLEKYKGYDKVIEALPALAKQFPHIKYIIGGKADATEKLRVEKMISDHGLHDHVILSGYVKDEEVQDHFQLADVFIMPSSREGFGIVFIEAMACGVPVIGGNIDGTVDALQNGKLGKLVNPANTAEITKAIADELSAVNPNAGLALQNAVIDKFGYLQYKQRLKEILEN